MDIAGYGWKRKVADAGNDKVGNVGGEEMVDHYV